MAELTKAVLGRVSGRLGDTVFRQRNGKNFLGTRPRKYTPPADQGSEDRRARFAFSSKLAQAIYSILELARFWQPLTPSGMSTFNYIIQKNILVVNPDSVTDLTSITPGHSFAVECTSASLTGNTMSVQLAAIGDLAGIDVSKAPNAKLVYVLSLTNPSNNTYPEFAFVSGGSDTKPLALDSSLTFNVGLSGQDAASIGVYGYRKLLVALVTLGADNVPVEYSGTVVTQLTITH